jgi:pilus assembly protein CpaE
MMTMNESARILLVSENPSLIEATRRILAKEESLNLLEREVTSKNLFEVIAPTQPDVILMDFETQNQSFYLVYKLATLYPMCAVVAILSESKMVYSERVVQLGAQALIQYPYPPDQLVSMIESLLEKLDRIPSYSSKGPGSAPGDNARHTFTVFSPKGGAGTTTIATNLAISLQKTLKEDLLLIDGKQFFGHVALYLNLRTGNSITDLTAQADMLDQRLIRQVVLPHTSGIQVLPSPNSITDGQGITPEDLFKVLQSLQQVYPNIIIDGGNHLNENTVTYMDSSEKILLVLNPDLASMRDVRQFIEISASLSYPEEKILIILNLAGRKENVQKEKIEKILQMKIFGTIPADEDLALSSLNEGVPILLKKPRHPISKAFSTITEELLDI